MQIGITLIGILAGAYSGASLGEPVAQRLALLGHRAGDREHRRLRRWSSSSPPTPRWSSARSFPSSSRCARPSRSRRSWPGRSLAVEDHRAVRVAARHDQRADFQALGLDRESRNQVTAEELHLVVAEAQTAGVLEESERAIISGIVRLADRPVREVMTPRTDVDWIDIDATSDEIRAALRGDPAQPDPGRRRLGRQYRRRHPDARPADRRRSTASRSISRRCAAQAPVIPDLMDAMDALAVLRARRRAAGAGPRRIWPFRRDRHARQHPRRAGRRLRSRCRDDERAAAGRARGRQLAGVGRGERRHAVSDRLGMRLPADRDFSTVAGFALSVLKHLPETGERFKHDGWSFEIVDMDGRKIDKLIASRAKAKKRDGEGGKRRLGRARACRTAARSRRCRRARDKRPARRSGRA